MIGLEKFMQYNKLSMDYYVLKTCLYKHRQLTKRLFWWEPNTCSQLFTQEWHTTQVFILIDQGLGASHKSKFINRKSLIAKNYGHETVQFVSCVFHLDLERLYAYSFVKSLRSKVSAIIAYRDDKCLHYHNNSEENAITPPWQHVSYHETAYLFVSKKLREKTLSRTAE